VIADLETEMSTKVMLPEAEYLATLPRKRMGVGVVFTTEDQILILKPTYKEHWLLPGGVIDADESPREAACREVREELGLDLKVGKLLVVDYLHSAGTRTECIQFMFEGPKLTADQLKAIQLQDEEIKEFKFTPFDEALKLISAHTAERLKISKERGLQTVYLENGREVT